MASWLSENATSIISASSALIGVGITGLINFFVSKANARTAKEARDSQNELERWKTKREFYINKAEELFTLFDKWHEAVYQLYLLTVCRTTRTKTAEQVNAEWNTYVDKSIQPRIHALLTLYYPELAPAFREMTDINSEIMTNYARCVSNNLNPSEYNISSLKHMEIIRQGSLAFKENLAKKTQQHL
ncbi:hypothetical protein ACR9HU_18370 [Enterobacter ludwigii]